MRIPARLAFNTGFPHPDATPVRALHEHVFEEIAARYAAEWRRHAGN